MKNYQVKYVSLLTMLKNFGHVQKLLNKGPFSNYVDKYLASFDQLPPTSTFSTLKR